MTMTSLTADASFWDRIAPRYATDPIKDAAGYERTLERTAALLAPTDHVLELGCGTGMTAVKLAGHVERLHGTDISAAMIDIARKRAATEGCTNVSFQVAAASERAAYRFDAVLAYNLLHLVSDRPSMLREAFAALKPGGLFISKTPCLSEMNPVIRLAVPLMRIIGKAPHVAFFNAEEIERDVEAAGFRVIERARHGSRGKDPRIFIVARKPQGR
jgi:ubiquinone/menaquinone biosynthesis C-methylase UbiE